MSTQGKRKNLCLIGLLAALAPLQPALAAGWDTATFDKVEGSLIQFKGAEGEKPLTLKTNLSDISYVGVLKPAGGGLPWFLVRAKLGPQESAIHAYRPGDVKTTSFVYPGRVLEPKSNAVTLDSRAFYGKCVSGRDDAYVVFQKERIEKKRKNGTKQIKHETSVFVAEVSKDHLNEKLFERGLPRIQDTLKRVKSKQCFEIEGRNRVMASRPPINGPWNENASDDDDDKDDEKEDAPAGDAKAPPSAVLLQDK